MEDLKYKEDIPLMREIIKEVDSVFELPSNKGVDLLKSSLKKFNDRWNDTRTWCFEINIYQSTVEVGEVLFNNQFDIIQETYQEQVEEEEKEEDSNDQDELTEITKEEWLKICKGVYTDENNLNLFLSVLNNSNSF